MEKNQGFALLEVLLALALFMGISLSLLEEQSKFVFLLAQQLHEETLEIQKENKQEAAWQT